MPLSHPETTPSRMCVKKPSSMRPAKKSWGPLLYRIRNCGPGGCWDQAFQVPLMWVNHWTRSRKHIWWWGFCECSDDPRIPGWNPYCSWPWNKSCFSWAPFVFICNTGYSGSVESNHVAFPLNSAVVFALDFQCTTLHGLMDKGFSWKGCCIDARPTVRATWWHEALLSKWGLEPWPWADVTP